MSSLTLVKCVHPACNCLVEPEQQFCSSFCASADDANTSPCACGHPACNVQEETPD